VHWYSHLDVQASSVLVLGETLPELEFTTYDAEPFYASMLLGKKIVYLFYRGNWCPVDMAQINELTMQYSDMKERGAEVILVSPQPFSETKKLADKLGVDFRFLTDVGNKMASLLEIVNEHGVPLGKVAKYEDDTVFPTVIIADEYGKIIYLDQTTNYRIRPEPDEYIPILEFS
jgi:peroxiredoxin